MSCLIPRCLEYHRAGSVHPILVFQHCRDVFYLPMPHILLHYKDVLLRVLVHVHRVSCVVDPAMPRPRSVQCANISYYPYTMRTVFCLEVIFVIAFFSVKEMAAAANNQEHLDALISVVTGGTNFHWSLIIPSSQPMWVSDEKFTVPIESNLWLHYELEL